VYLAFLLFELTVGMFYPSYGSIKSQNIPEEVRSGVMNIFRIPLNGAWCGFGRFVASGSGWCGVVVVHGG
jgi:hypothetical protein